MTDTIVFAEVFARMSDLNSTEETVTVGGMNVRLVRVPGGAAGRWDNHAETAETVLVWSGTSQVEFRDRNLLLLAGQCCVVPVQTDHRGTSPNGAEIVLFTNAG